MSRPGRMPRRLFFLLSLGVIVFCAVIGSLISMTIWPGEAKLTAPLFCDDVYSQAVIVRDTSSRSGKTSINFTMYCLGERGQHRNVGWLRPMGVLMLAHFVLLCLAVGAVALWVRHRHRQGRSATITIDLSRS